MPSMNPLFRSIAFYQKHGDICGVIVYGICDISRRILIRADKPTSDAYFLLGYHFERLAFHASGESLILTNGKKFKFIANSDGYCEFLEKFKTAGFNNAIVGLKTALIPDKFGRQAKCRMMKAIEEYCNQNDS